MSINTTREVPGAWTVAAATSDKTENKGFAFDTRDAKFDN
jgi:hypothetical protein